MCLFVSGLSLILIASYVCIKKKKKKKMNVWQHSTVQVHPETNVVVTALFSSAETRSFLCMHACVYVAARTLYGCNVCCCTCECDETACVKGHTSAGI
jgi:hypothetical protein